MATQTIEFRSPPSQTITAKLFAVGSDTQVDSVSTTEATNRKGTYSAAYTNVPAGEYELIALVSTTPVARWFVTLTLTTATFQVYDKSQTVLMVADVVNASALAADAVAEIQSGLATPTNITAATGITVSSIGANVVNASALAADAVAEIQSGLALAATALSTAQWTNTLATNIGTTNTTVAANLDATVSSRLASASYTAPSNLTAAQIATGVWQDATAGDFTTASSVGKSLYNAFTAGTSVFTVAALANAPSGGGGGGGGDPWATVEPGSYIAGTFGYLLSTQIADKTDLLNPAPTGSVLLVNSGAYYCTRQDVELVFGTKNVIAWADLDNEADATFIEDRITTMIALAHELTNDALREGAYTIPIVAPVPTSLTYNVAGLAGVLLYESRGAVDAESDDGTHRLTPFRKRWDTYIKNLLGRKMVISAPRSVTNNAPSVS